MFLRMWRNVHAENLEKQNPTHMLRCILVMILLYNVAEKQKKKTATLVVYLLI